MAQSLTLVELNCENLFDTQHDSLKQDTEFLPESLRRWTRTRYWRKLANLSQELMACVDDGVPDLVALCEVENDSVVRDLVRRSALRTVRYDYLVTASPDVRGIDVALLYSPFSFAPISHRSITVPPLKGMRPTRDILYVCGQVVTDDTLHLLLVHAPSKYAGIGVTRAHRRRVAETLSAVLDSIRHTSPEAWIVVAGDFNETAREPTMRWLESRQLNDVTAKAVGRHGQARGTYRYEGAWGSLDHVLVSPSLVPVVTEAYVEDAPFLLEDDEKYGGVKPYRTYLGPRYLGGFSDHLPLVVRFSLEQPQKERMK